MTMKNIEGPFVRYQMNDCGYRGTASCGPKPAGTLRVVIMGTSAAFGLHVPYDELFVNRAAPELSRIWHHPVEFQNLGDAGPDWSKSHLLLDEMRSLRPDAVFFVVVPFDLNRMDYLQSVRGSKDAALPARKMTGWTWTDVRLALRESRFFYMAQHFLLRDENFFLRAFENYADPFDISRKPASPMVLQRLARMDMMVGKLADYSHAAGIPCYMLALPNRVESALISRNVEMPGMDAYVFPERMKEIAQRHGMGYIDMVPELRKTPNAEKLFYPVDGHPNGDAHALMARAVLAYFRQRGSTVCGPRQTSAIEKAKAGHG
jgi:hypothetical protein